MIKKYKKRPFHLEAVKLNHGNVKECVKWLKDNGEECSHFVSHIMFGARISQKIVNIGEYLIRGLGGVFSVMSSEMFERCYEKIEEEEKKTVKNVAKK
jgi:Icc-related predicted phosphoesterase